MKTKFLVLFIVATAFFQGKAIAQPPPERPFAFFQGFYLGQGLGVAFNLANVDLSSSAFLNGAAPTERVNFNHRSHLDLYQYRLYGELYGGWGYQFCFGLHLGARLGVNFSSFDIKHKEKTEAENPLDAVTTGYLRQKTEQQSQIHSVDYTYDARIGWAFGQDTLLYALIGGTLNRPEIKLSSDSKFEFFSPLGVIATQQNSVSKRSRNYRHNLHLGCGVEQKITSHLGLNLIYAYTNYSKRKTSVRGSAGTAAALEVDHLAQAKARLRRHAVTIGVAYHF